MKRNKMKTPHNKRKIKVNYLGFSSYEHKEYQKTSLYGFLRINFVFITLMGLGKLFNVYNTPHELINPLVSINEVEQVQAVEVTPEPNPCSFIENEIEQYICEVFEEEYENAMAVLSCENASLNPLAINDANSNGSTDVGIFQINSIHGFTVEEMQDYKANVDFAHKLMHRDGWQAWSCSYVIDVTPFYLK